MSGLKRVIFFSIAALVSLPTVAGAAPTPHAQAGRLVEVVVVLDAPPLAQAGGMHVLAASRVDSAQRSLEAHLQNEIPGAVVARRYRIVVDGLAVSLPQSEVAVLGRLPGVAQVYPSLTYHALRSSSPGFIGAPALWGPTLATAGNGMKIGIIDDGIDKTHPYFRAKGYRMPRGFPRGQRAFTSAKVIVARAFAPRSPKWRYATRPFDPLFSDHATHVAGIAAGNYRTLARGQRISGVAPKAYLGNYKVLTIPTVTGFGLNGNSPEIVAAIEAAVKDGMDVINLSLGEAEVEPGRDIVARALDGAAAAGVVPVVAAGNDFEEFGFGSITSPANSSKAISVAAEAESGPAVAGFSSGGPTPLSLQMKPDVTAPGLSVFSSVPRREGLWALFSGTSMAAPHVAGAAALLAQRHPGWTVEQLKSALVQTGGTVYMGNLADETESTREGGGTVNLVRADAPLLFASPTGLSFGLVNTTGTLYSRPVHLTDAGGGAGQWTVTVSPQRQPQGSTVTVPPTVVVPGDLPVSVAAAPGATQADHTGFIVLTRGADRRRIPYWFRVASPALAAAAVTLTRTGTYHGDTRGQPALVDSYRYPDDPRELGVPRFLLGPEQVFRVSLRKPVANFGVVVIRGGSSIQPRVVRAGNENQLVGEIGLPFNANPYLARFGVPIPVAGDALPGAGDYDIVFDSVAPSGARAFTFRFWIGDTTPPRLRFLSARRGLLRISARDTGSGIDPSTIRLTVDGHGRRARYDSRRGLVTASIRGLHPGRHYFTLRASDYQESKNMENVPRILPNTRRLHTAFRVT